MRKALRVLLCAAFALFAVFLASSALVERPALLTEASAERRTVPVTLAGLTIESRALPEASTAEAPQTRAGAERTCLPDESAAALPCDRVSRDGNGYPITGGSYVKTVYTAFPLQDMPG